MWTVWSHPFYLQGVWGLTMEDTEVGIDFGGRSRGENPAKLRRVLCTVRFGGFCSKRAVSTAWKAKV